MDEEYWPLWRKWVAWQRRGGSADDEVAVAGESAAPADVEVGRSDEGSGLKQVAVYELPVNEGDDEAEEEGTDAAHYLLSSYREAMLEHLLIGEMMRKS